MIADSTFAIVGLGLMGGSLARAVSARGARVLGYDRNAGHLEQALREGVVREALGHDLSGMERADIVVLALPVDATCHAMTMLARRAARARLLMDLASTKQSVVSCAESAGIGERFVGAHPLTGSHRSGWNAASESLFEGARVFLCPTSVTSVSALQLAEQLWSSLRACTEALDARTHDDEMAWRSHLPHVVASALAATLGEAGIARAALGPGGRDMTRLAGSSTDVWSAIVADNAAAIASALLAYESRLRAFRQAIERGDRPATRSLLEAGRAWFDATQEEALTSRCVDG